MRGIEFFHSDRESSLFAVENAFPCNGFISCKSCLRIDLTRFRIFLPCYDQDQYAYCRFHSSVHIEESKSIHRFDHFLDDLQVCNRPGEIQMIQDVGGKVVLCRYFLALVIVRQTVVDQRGQIAVYSFICQTRLETAFKFCVLSVSLCSTSNSRLMLSVPRKSKIYGSLKT